MKKKNLIKEIRLYAAFLGKSQDPGDQTLITEF